MENKHIKYFLNDVSDQYESQHSIQKLAPALSKQQKALNKQILDDIYQNVVKLETDLTQEYVIEDLLNLQNFINQQNFQINKDIEVDQNQIDYVIQHQYDLIGAKMRLRYGGKSLNQIITACLQQNQTDP